MTNPYASPETVQSLATRQPPRWLRRAIILNALLLTIPLIGLTVFYAFICLSAACESATQTGDPVVYQHFFWITIDPWFASAYFTVPNGILAGLFARWEFRSTNESSNDEAAR